MGLAIRDARPGDRAAIQAINRDGQPGVTALSEAEIDACLARATLFRVALEGDLVSAYVIALAPGFAEIGDEYAWFSRRLDSFLYVDQIAVAAGAQRQGVASALYADLERAARERDLGRLVCEVNLRPPNPRSLALHASRGFRELGRLEVSDGRFVALLAKELEQPAA
ncbi:MAG: GNAT family N-acetyltransferase [Myxococcota bacterium]